MGEELYWEKTGTENGKERDRVGEMKKEMRKERQYRGDMCYLQPKPNYELLHNNEALIFCFLP